MSTDTQQAAIEETLAFCKMHWVATEVPVDDVVEMLAELRQHLEESAEDGKTVEDVVGLDTGTFAREWAAANQSPKSLERALEAPLRLALNCLSDTLAVITVLVGLCHLLLWSPNLPFSVEELLCTVVFMLSFFLFFASSTRLSETQSSTNKSFWRGFPKWLRVVLYVALFGSLVAWSLLPLAKATLFVWPWQATLVLPLVAVLPRSLNKFITRIEKEAK